MAKNRLEAPYYPIIYVRGYAGTDDEVEDTVSDPYMGFNLGSTRIRQQWTGDIRRHYFESPLVRLMKDFGYRDVYSAGLDMAPDAPIEPRSVVIYRYYDLVSSSFGDGERIPIETFGQGLSDLILSLRDRVCTTPTENEKFRVYLVGHSMGGLVIRCFLQNDAVGDPAAKSLVDKVVTYATPHRGIEMEIIGNVPAFFTHNNADNFNHDRMIEYLGLPKDSKDVNSLDGKFDPDRFLCLVGTNSKDYVAARGWSSRVVGPYSDGLVRINNAIVLGPPKTATGTTVLAPRAYMHRSHSGYFGIVNSEEGFQNLNRFLFGNVRVDGHLDIHLLTLPPAIARELKDGKQVNASYHFEAVTRVRGTNWDLSRRVAAEHSTVFRKFGELFPDNAIPGDRKLHDRPQLFTTYLSKAAKVVTQRASLGFSIDLGVLVPDYEVAGMLWMKDHYDGGYLYREKINLEAIPPQQGGDTWSVRYGFDSRTPNRTSKAAIRIVGDHELQFHIPITQKTRPGIEATLVLIARDWNIEQ